MVKTATCQSLDSLIASARSARISSPTMRAALFCRPIAPSFAVCQKIGYLRGSRGPREACIFSSVVGTVVVGRRSEPAHRRLPENGWKPSPQSPGRSNGPRPRAQETCLPWQRRFRPGTPHTASTFMSRAWSGAELFASGPQIRHQDPKLRILARKRSRLRTTTLPSRRNLGPMVMRVASFFQVQTTYYLKAQLHRAGTGKGEVGCRKDGQRLPRVTTSRHCGRRRQMKPRHHRQPGLTTGR